MRGRQLRRRVLYQTNAVPTPQTLARTPQGWSGFFEGRLPQRILAASITSFAVLAPFQVPTQFIASDQSAEPAERVPPTLVREHWQQFSDVPLYTPVVAVYSDPSAEVPDAVLPSRRVEVALLQFDVRVPPPPVVYADQSTEIPDAVLPSRRVEAALVQFDSFPPQGTVVSTTPQGFAAVFPDRFAKRFPVSAQMFAPWAAQGDLVSTPQGWPVAWPERFTRKFPVSAQLVSGDQWIGNVPTAATAQGWPATFPDRFARPYPASLQRFDQFPQYQVATATTPQGWVAVFPERFARKVPAAVQQFDLPVLSAYASVVVTYPEGWSAVFDGPARRARVRGEAFEIGLPAAGTPRGWSAFADTARLRAVKDAGAAVSVTPAAQAPQGWSVVEPALRRSGKPQGAEFTPAALARTVWGWGTAFDSRTARRALPAVPEPFVATPAAVLTHGWVVKVSDHAPRRMGRATAVASGLDRTPPSVDFPDGWPVEFSIAFKKQVAMPFEFFRWGRNEVVIIGKPPLSGGDGAPTLKGKEAEATLLGQDAEATLKGRDAQPQEDAALFDPTLKGKV